MKAESNEGKFLETDKNYIEVAIEGYGEVSTVSIDNFTEIKVSLVFGNGIAIGIKCEFGRVDYETVFVREMSKGERIDYNLLQSVVLNRLHLILNERFFPMDYVKRSIFDIKPDCFGKDTIILNLSYLISDAFNYCAEEFRRVEKEQDTPFWIKVGRETVENKKENKKESKKLAKDKNKKESKENKKNKNKKDKK